MQRADDNETGGNLWDHLTGERQSPEVATLLHQPLDDSTREHAKNLRESLSDNLSELLSCVDPIPILGRIAGLLAYRGKGPGVDIYRWGAEARLQYLAAVALNNSRRPTRQPNPNHVQAALELTRDLFDLERRLIRQEEALSENEYVNAVRMGLRVEHLEDRFTGYTRYLLEIEEALLPRFAEQFNAEFGWNPKRIDPVARGASRLIMRRLDSLGAAILREFGGPAEIHADESKLYEVVAIQDRETPKAFQISTRELADETGSDSGELRRMLNDMAYPWGGLDRPIRFPSDDNPFRWLGIIKLGNDVWSVPLPQLVPQEWSNLVDWLLSRSGSAALRTRWNKAKETVTETLVRDRLVRLFLLIEHYIVSATGVDRSRVSLTSSSSSTTTH